MVKRAEIEDVLNHALKDKGDFAELFFEDTEELQLKSVDGIVQGQKTAKVCGAGLYLLNGNHSIYVYSNKSDYENLLKMAETASDLMTVQQRNGRMIPPVQLGTMGTTEIKEYRELDHVPEIMKMMRNTDLALREKEYLLQKLELQYYFSNRKIKIANSEGLFECDQRPTTRLRYAMTVGDGITNAARVKDIYKQGGFETFLEGDESIRFGKDLAKCLLDRRKARAIKPCRVPLILDGGEGATLFHECVGHMVEGNSILRGNNPYAHMLGQVVASEKVNLYDDATYPNVLATCRIDDEGMPSQRVPIIENGVLKNFLLDRLSARKLGMNPNGCGRRQNYMFAPASRMSNTYLLEGSDDNEEMIRDIDHGLYVTSTGGGVEGEQFCLAMQDAYWIENGEITYPVKDMSLTGNGIEIMKKIDRVGTTMGSFDGAFCGADSGLIPTTTNQPRIRISEVSLG